MSASPSPSPQTPAPATPVAAEAPKSFKDTLNLPQTAFGMKANLVQNEPASIKRWDAMKLYERVRESSAGKPKFLFHDGPPYANGSIHVGHVLNKILKDIVVRSRTMMGFDVPYVPGWDCHGLPIEHKVMLELVESGKIAKLNTLTDDQRRMAVRRECQKYAEKFHKLHTAQFTRLLTLADYEHPYLTMVPSYEGATLEVLAALMEAGLVYRALKPVHWSVANETALAEAELEYADRLDTSAFVDFEALEPDAVYDAFGLPKDDLTTEDTEDTEEEAELSEEEQAAAGSWKERAAEARLEKMFGKRPMQRPSFMIWTTTPWTLPANVGVAVNAREQYSLVFIDGNVTVLASKLIEKVTKLAGSTDVAVIATTTGDKLVGLRYRHPFVENPPACGLGRVCDPKKLWSVVAAEYVTMEDGTGLVHTAPGHGEEDYATGLREHLPVYSPVLANGTYDDTVPEWLRGVDVWKANELVLNWLRDSGHLFFDQKFSHSYPHDWRSKTPTIFRCTEQWFVSVEQAYTPRGAGASTTGESRSIRQRALDAVGASDTSKATVQFVPEWGRNRMRGMLESRPDWCISRQRAWGLPIPAFLTPQGGVLMTAASVRAVAKLVREKGADVWFQSTPAELLKYYDPASDADPSAKAMLGRTPEDQALALANLKKGGDILDVWFESGSSWNAVLRERGLGYPADLYLEGSDQHRGWFQLAILTALGVTGQAPYRAILTHGFLVAKDGRKFSKSSGDTVEELFQKYGVDVLRWWVSSLTYENDIKVDDEFFDQAGESYRKIRNTLRFMLSNLNDYTPPTGGTGVPPVSAASAEPGGRGPTNTGGTPVPPPHSFAANSLDAWVLAQFDALADTVVKAYDAYDYRTAHAALYGFCNDTLSATYLAAIKDRLYCDKPDSARRRRTQAALFAMTDGLCRLLAPVLVHTADEAYRALHRVDAKDTSRTIHTLEFARPTGVKADAGWMTVLAARSLVHEAIERAKKDSGVENPLDAGVAVTGLPAGFDPVDLADLFGVSRVTAEGGDKASVRVIDLRNEPRCERSWKRDGTVRQRAGAGGLPSAMLSDRDAIAVGM